MLNDSQQQFFKLVQIGGIRVWLRVEPVEAALKRGGFDGLLIHDDSKLSMSDPVSRAVMKAAGSIVAEEAAALGPQAVGSIAATSAGALDARFIFHAVTSDVETGRGATERTMRQLARTVLIRCEALGVRRLAILGSAEGTTGLDPARVAQLFGFGLNEHLANPTQLEEVILVLPNQEALTAYLSAEIGDSGFETRAVFESMSSKEAVFIDYLEAPPMRTQRPRAKRGALLIGGIVLALVAVVGLAVIFSSRPVSPPENPRPQVGSVGSMTNLIVLLALAAGSVAAAAVIWRASSRRKRLLELDLQTRRAAAAESPLSTETTHLPSPNTRTIPSAPAHAARRSIPLDDLSDESTRPSPSFSADRYYGETYHRPLFIGRYVMLEEIGRGAMGVVHLSWDLLLRRVVAIKTLRVDLESPSHTVESLRREARVAMDLDHEGIVRLFHYEPGDRSSGPFLVMEYVPWSTGEQWIADSGSFGLPSEAVRDVGIQLCHTLAYAHARGVLHLDIKPSNIFVDPAGERTKLADFGLARALGRPSGQAMQVRFAGTPAYMAPEQKKLGAKVSPRTDVYLLSATLWDLATGSPPGGDSGKVPAFDIRSRSLLSVLAEALAEDPASRPAGGRAFAERLCATA